MIRGYTAPEYAIHGHLSEKVDTYSFGVVILEIISGRRSSDMNVDSDTEYLLEEVNVSPTTSIRRVYCKKLPYIFYFKLLEVCVFFINKISLYNGVFSGVFCLNHRGVFC